MLEDTWPRGIRTVGEHNIISQYTRQYQTWRWREVMLSPYICESRSYIGPRISYILPDLLNLYNEQHTLVFIESISQSVVATLKQHAVPPPGVQCIFSAERRSARNHAA